MKQLALFLVLFTAVVAVADWKSFFHGTPPTATPGPPDSKAATVSFAPALAADAQVTEFMRAFAEAMRIHDGTSLKPRLSDKYSIEDLPDDQSAVDFFMQAMVKIKAPDEIVVTSIEHEGDIRVVTTEFHVPERSKTRIFKFDPAGKLLSADFFKLQRHG